jgi:acyl-CoA synthetase (AMP-forming)/AMP-acid ligase II
VYGHVGTPLDCCMVKLVDVPDMEYTSLDRPYPRGEVWVSGSNVFQGYFKQPDMTAEVFHTDPEGRKWFLTGDIAMWLPDGTLKIIDRKKVVGCRACCASCMIALLVSFSLVLMPLPPVSCSPSCRHGCSGSVQAEPRRVSPARVH